MLSCTTIPTTREQMTAAQRCAMRPNVGATNAAALELSYGCDCVHLSQFWLTPFSPTALHL
eukprot:11864175-Prorocentrum_lima.AAC.1